MISVILPTYNRAAWLGRAITSILGQTHQDLELIVVDDGSTDDTPKLRETWERTDARIRWLRRNHQGAAAARNTGLAAARGELIAFCDSDDEWLEHKLERQVAYLDRHPGAGLVYGDAAVFRNGQVQTPSYFADRAPQEGWVFERLFESNFIPNVTVVARRRCLEAIEGYNESLRTSEDYELWLRFSQRFPVGYVPGVLVHVHRHGDNLTEDVGRAYAAHLAVLDRISAQADGMLPGRVRRRAYGRTYLAMGYDYLMNGQAAKARRALWRSWRQGPASARVYRYLLSSLLPFSTALVRWRKGAQG